MTPERWRLITDVFNAALAVDASERPSLVARMCGDDAELRSEVEALLEGHAHAGSFDAAAVAAMPWLVAGTRLGPYRIASLIGAGGMGQVYRAIDTRLDRIVAIKVLSPHLRESAAVRTRFEREARAISQLAHPHICALHDVGRDGETDFLVMEYVEGETLAARLDRGPLPLGEALRITQEVAAALTHAHRRGIVHRDLKPANVMLTDTGAKLLDFGIAALAAGSTMPGTPATIPGVLLGTPAYMAPEQVQGRDIDGRADVWALGRVLDEMLTGASVPPDVRQLIARCLRTDRTERWPSAAELARALERIRNPRRRWRPVLAWTTAVIVLAGFSFLAAGTAWRRTVPPTVTFTFEPPPMLNHNMFAISPDGTMLAVSGVNAAGHRRMFLRMLSGADVVELPGTEGAMHPIWSPDSRFIAFGANKELKVLAVSTRAVRLLCRMPVAFGGTWSADGTILFAGTQDGETVLFRIPAAGDAAPQRVTALDRAAQDVHHAYPQFLPDGRHYLYLRVQQERAGVWVGSLDGGDARLIVPLKTNAVFMPPDALLYHRDSTLLVQRFDTRRLQLVGDAVPLADRLTDNPRSGYAGFGVSRNGTLVYRSSASGVHLTWRARDGATESTLDIAQDALGMRLSSDGSRLVYASPREPKGNLWTFDLRGGTATKITSTRSDKWPVWSPDGSRIGFTSSRQGLREEQLYEIAADRGRGEHFLIAPDERVNYCLIDWSRHALLYYLVSRTLPRRVEVRFLPPSGQGPSTLYMQSAQAPVRGQLSPNGRWFAYDTDDPSGEANQVFVRAFPNHHDHPLQVSTDGGRYPRWSPDGRELFYYDPGHQALWSASIDPGAASLVTSRRKVFDVSMNSMKVGPDYPYDVSPDGQHFLVFDDGVTPHSAPVTVVLHWRSPLNQ